MTYKTAETAHEMACPFARTFIRAGVATAKDAGCIGPKCALWRWQTTDAWRNAVVEIAKTTGESGKGHMSASPKAAAIVAKDPAAYGCEGMCGAGGGR